MSQVFLPDRMPLAALGLAAAAAWVGTGAGPVRRLPHLPGVKTHGSRPEGSGEAGERLRQPAPARTAGLGRLRHLWVTCIPLAVVVGGLFRSLPVGLLVLAAGVALSRYHLARSRARDEAQRRAAVLVLCTALVAELRAGRSPRDALTWAAGPDGADVGIQRLRAALTYDRDVPTVLRELAAQPGACGLRRLAACWQVAERSGAGLATAVDRVANGLRGEEAQRREISAQLAGPRATARLVAVLPVFGLMLAAGLGGDPLHVLLATPYGLVCLGLGLALDVAGVLWTERIASTAERAL
jgi:tight adherence protein B